MKLSVVVPVYNGADFIQKSFKSILNQNLDDYEIVYVNNNSTDNSVQLIEDLQKNDPRIKLYHQTRQGEAQARNMGIEKAVGKYIYQLDVDDEVFPGAVNKMISVLDMYPEMDAVFGKMLKSDKTMVHTAKPLDETDEIIIKERPFWGLAWFSDLSIVVGAAAFLYRKSTFEKIGIYTEKLKIIGTDTEFDIRLGMTCNVAFIDTYIYLYFKHPVSLIETVKNKMDRVFMQWPRLVLCHLPFYLQNPEELEFKELLLRQIYNAMGKILYLTKGIGSRKEQKSKLLKEVEPIKPPFIIRFFLNLMVWIRSEYLYKFYVYYVVNYHIKKAFKKR